MSRYRLSPGEEVSLLARAQDPPAGAALSLSAEIRDLSGRVRPRRVRLAPVGEGRYRLAVRGARPGRYRIRVLAAAGSSEWAEAGLHFSVQGEDVEGLDTTPDFEALARLAGDSGGAFLGPADIPRLPALVAAKLPSPEPRVRRAERSIWDRLPALLAALGAACGAWVLLRPGSSRVLSASK
jgi:hypothetical protein